MLFRSCDNASVREMTELILQSDGQAYLRLDRYGVETAAFDPETIGKGFQVARPVQKVTLAASGYMVKTALTAAEQLAAAGIPVGVVDICTLPCDAALCGILSEVQTLVTLEEHTLPGGLGSYLMELASEKGLSAQIRIRKSCPDPDERNREIHPCCIQPDLFKTPHRQER